MESSVIHISTAPMETVKGNTNYALPLCKKGPPLSVGGTQCHFAGEDHRQDDIRGQYPADSVPSYSLITPLDLKGWWEDFEGEWCEECYAIAKEEGERIRIMIALEGGAM